MAKKISQLTQATQVKSDDVTVIVQDGETKKLPLNMMVTKQDIENKKVAGLAKLDEIEATYENDTYTPTIAVKNKSSVKVGEGDGVDYSANVMDGHVKSAILKGQTLVNLCKDSWWNGFLTNGYDITQPLKPNNKYIIFVNSINNIAEINLAKSDFIPIVYSTNNNDNYFIFTTPDSTSELTKVRIALSEVPSSEPHYEAILLEYQEGIENWNIPYFEGMQSVKMPVLKTTGKNLFDINNANIFNGYGSGDKCVGNNNMRSLIFNVKEGCTYTIQKTNESSRFAIDCTIAEPKDGTKVKRLFNANTATKATVTIPIGYNYIFIYYANSEVGDDLDIMPILQIEQGTQATSYEPYKSNILTAKEDVVLRGIGNVKDTLDISTGEKVERIGEVFLNGSEGWSYNPNWSNGDYLASYTKFFTSKANGSYNILSNNIQTGRFITNGVPTSEFICGENGSHVVYVCLRKDRLLSSPSDNINDYRQAFLEYLQKNPITVQYQLATESIKTVDLMPSGTHPSTTPYCWKNGHIQLSSSGLLPNLEYSVVTSRAGQINQNATMIVKNDKRIFDLEILLAGGLVNTTYQALTLQNQVETGLSKVSLNSETEPDYLLYHMIMKLIEEKAYKLDDLTEKVSVFYLYEKLSDEQFETIYSALYPFVEDEIVEEPVVEELPEVVEDEVIM